MLAVGEHVLGPLDSNTIKLATGLGGGIGGSHLETCGILTGGVMIIGALHGRAHVEQDDRVCYALAKRFRQRFLERFGATTCAALWASGYGPHGGEPCAVLAERAVPILLEVIAEGESPPSATA